jgi:hypothetical protein
MIVLDEQQVTLILDDIKRNGIEMEELQLSLLDHICCVLEEELSPEMNFETAYRNVLPRFFEKNLREIQEETELLLIFKNYYAMKKVMLNTGVISAVVFTFGAIFKIMHWPGAGLLLQLPIVLISFIFLPLLFLIKSKETKKIQEKAVLGVGVVFGIILSLSGLCKVMHWPGANMLWLLALGILFLIFLPLYFSGGIRNPETKTNTIVSSVLILMAGGLFFTLTDLSGKTHKSEALTLQSDAQVVVASQHLQNQNQKKYALESDLDQMAKNKIVKLKSKLLCEQIGLIRRMLIMQVPGQPDMNETDFLREFGQAFYPVTELLFDQNNKPCKELTNVKTGISELKSFFSTNYQLETSDLLNTSDAEDFESASSKKVSWEITNFHMVEARQVLRYLNTLILEIKIMESDCI